jgi:hypothetical protein
MTLIKLNSEFRKRIIDEYFKDDSWRKIIQTIDQNAILKNNVAKLAFVRESQTMLKESDSYMTSKMKVSHSNEMKNSEFSFTEDKNLIYYVNRSIDHKRLCISSDCVSNILIIVHDQEHSELETCFEIISRFWYIKELIKVLRQYIRHCSKCLII